VVRLGAELGNPGTPSPPEGVADCRLTDHEPGAACYVENGVGRFRSVQEVVIDPGRGRTGVPPPRHESALDAPLRAVWGGGGLRCATAESTTSQT
jgi:hypothetical protein